MSNDPAFWLWAGAERVTNPATGESVDGAGAPVRRVIPISSPKVNTVPVVFVRRDDRGAES